jgi:CubicO group peptidase (beta-lactamase class C family)
VPFDVYDNEAYYGSANLYFSARDLHRWVTSWYSDPVLSEAALARGMEVPVFANGERSAFNRLAWYWLPGRRAYFFTGHWRGFHHEIYWDAERRLSVVWVTNVLEAKPLPPLLTRALIDILDGKSPASVAAPDFQAPEPGGNVERMVGTFDVASVGRVTVTANGGNLFFQVDDGAQHRGFPAGSYTIPDLYARVWFSEIEAGRYQKLHWLSLLGVAVGERLAAVGQ